MSVALAANAPATFEIKSANLPLVALLLKSADLVRLSEELAQRFGDMPDFFDQDPLVIDLSPLQGAEAAGLESESDFAALADLLRQYRLQPIAVRGGSDAQTRCILHCHRASRRTARHGAYSPSHRHTPGHKRAPPGW